MRSVQSRRARRAACSLAALAGVLLVAGALAACGSSTSGGSSPSPSDAAVGTSLDGTSWRLSGWSADSLQPSDFTITAEFSDGRIGGKSAVNTYGGPYTTGPGDAFSTGELVSTMMAGPEEDMRAERIYLDLLAAAASYKREGDTLTLSDKGGNESLIFSAAGN